MMEGHLPFTSIISEVISLIRESRQQMAVHVNEELTALYWSVGMQIRKEVLKDQRAQYGKKVIQKLSENLTREFGSGWSEQHLRHCLRSADTFQDEQIFSALRREFTWTHIKALAYLNDDLQRHFYIEMCKLEKWSSRTLSDKINGMLYERTALSKKPEKLIKKELDHLSKTGDLSPDLVFRNTYFLDFLGLKDTYSEKDLESAILKEIQHFIQELGGDFAFMARQKRLSIDSTDYYIDLLFYHRSLKRLVAIDLKLGKFKPEHEGQMLLYLRWLQKYEMKPGEETPIGLILCSEGNTEHIELLMLEDGHIRVAQYLTELPDKKLLEQKLHQAIQIARNRLNE